ncbi:hypothetical protein TWF506_005208 [Arthrobotrys conoides]|uniref:Uncharacterized protein n=1 Tax=Arthrobotrys conoides TaxID=74498 RepID=A0AAN8NT51_9PEZI
MLRIRSKEDFFISGTSPWASQSKRRSRKQYVGTWQERNEQQCLKGSGSSILDPGVIDDIENLVVSEVGPKKPRPTNEVLIDEAEISSPSPLAREQVSGQSVDNKSDKRAETTFPLREPPKRTKSGDGKGLGLVSTPSSPKEFSCGSRLQDKTTKEDGNIIEMTCHEDTSPSIYGNEKVELKKTNPVDLGKRSAEGSQQNSSKGSRPEIPQTTFNNRFLFNDSSNIKPLPSMIEGISCNIKSHKSPTKPNSQPSSPIDSPLVKTSNLLKDIQTQLPLPQESEMPFTRAYKRAAEVSGVALEEETRADHQPKRIRVNDMQDTPPAATSKLKKKGRKLQGAHTHRKQVDRTTTVGVKVQTTNSPSLEISQNDRIESGDKGMEWAIALSNNLNPTYRLETSPSAVPEASSGHISILPKTPLIMPRNPSKEPFSSPRAQLVESKVASQSNASSSAAALPSSLPISRTSANSQQKMGYIDSPERPTIISEVSDEKFEKRKIFVPDHAAVQSLNRLFFTPRPERLLTREEMSRFLDPDLLPRFNPALRRPAKK